MKTKIIYILLGALWLASPLMAQDVPQAVQNKLTKIYPEVNAPAWTTEGDFYVAEFLSDDRMYRAKFTEQAEWVNTRSAIPREEMPRNALDFLKTNYPDALINGYQYYESPGGQFYEVMISMDSQEKNLHFDKEGNISKIQGDMEVNRESGQ